MTKAEHLELNKWQREILDGLKAAQMCPDSASARLLTIEAAKNMQFLGENLQGGLIHLDGGETVETGSFLKDMARLLVCDAEGQHLPRLIHILEHMLITHDKHIAKLPDAN